MKHIERKRKRRENNERIKLEVIEARKEWFLTGIDTQRHGPFFARQPAIVKSS